MASAGSPGSSCCSPKMITDTKNSVGIELQQAFAEEREHLGSDHGGVDPSRRQSTIALPGATAAADLVAHCFSLAPVSLIKPSGICL